MFTDCSIAKERVSIYEKYEKLKKEKGKLCLDMLTIEDLYQMWSVENYSDTCIGDLFDVKKEEIRKLRYKYDIKLRNVASMRFSLAFEQAMYLHRQQQSKF